MIVTTIEAGPPSVVTTISAPDSQGVAVTVIGTLNTSIGANYGPRAITTLREGLRGATGPAGADVATYTAATVINGHKLLAVNDDGQVAHADITDSDAPFLFVGMSETAAGAGATLTVRRFGPVTFSGWAWTDGLVYLGTDGDPTQAPLDGEPTFVVGFGSGPTLYLNPQPPVYPPL